MSKRLNMLVSFQNKNQPERQSRLHQDGAVADGRHHPLGQRCRGHGDAVDGGMVEAIGLGIPKNEDNLEGNRLDTTGT